MRRSPRRGSTPKTQSSDAETPEKNGASRRQTHSSGLSSAADAISASSSGRRTSRKRASTPPTHRHPQTPSATPDIPAGSSRNSTNPRGYGSGGMRNRDLDVSRRYGIAAGLALVGVRVAGGLLTPIADCDETYNYWEPLHYMLYGTGMQTWEYSPVYILRSYAYLLPHATIGKALALVLQLIQGPLLPDKRLIFYGLRVLLSLISAACEATFVDGIARRLGARPGFLTFLLLLTSAGLFQASPALLPSSAACNLVMVTTANWLTRRYWWATFFAVAAVLALGWPFVALLFLPLALHVLHDCIYSSPRGPDGSPQYQRGTIRVLSYGIGALLLLLPPVLLIDAYFYRRLAFPALNILLYNVGGGPQGADDKLYGVEPWSFYLKNLLLNLNVALPLALLLPVLLPSLPWPAWPARAKPEAFVFVSPAFLWLGVMTLRPHKEERFLFPIYPLLALCAALSLHGLAAAFESFASAGGEEEGGGKWKSSSSSSSSNSSNKTPGGKKTVRSSNSAEQPPSSFYSFFSSLLLRLAQRLANLLAKALIPIALLLHTLLSLSRVVSMTQNFAAPLHLFRDFSQTQRTSYLLQQQASHSILPPSRHSKPTRLCLGAEWYRFPSSFFLPHADIQLTFVRAGFGGQLPQPFRPKNGTWAPSLQPFNEYNREETSRYVPIHSCHYLVELFPPYPEEPQQQHQQHQQHQHEEKEYESEDEHIAHHIKWVDTRLRELGETKPVAWKVLRHYPLLDKDLSPSPWRSFWVPFASGPRLHYGAFTLLEREEEEGVDPGPTLVEEGFM